MIQCKTQATLLYILDESANCSLLYYKKGEAASEMMRLL